MSAVFSPMTGSRRKRALAGSIKAICAALAVTAVMGSAEASAQNGLFRRLIAQAQANRASVDQSGANNGAAVSQSGAGNGASIAQTGNDNTAVLRQNGDDNYGRLVQRGSGSSLAVTQNNSGNALCFIQRGDNLGAEVVQNGGDSAILVQNRHGVRAVTNRVPRACDPSPPPVQRRGLGTWR